MTGLYWRGFAILLTVCLGVGNCRESNLGDMGTETDTDTDTLPPPAKGGGCPETHQDQFDNGQSPYRGGSEAVLVEVSGATDFHCPFCLSLAMELIGFYDDPNFERFVRMYHHHFPLVQHADVLDIHKAAVATQNQDNDKFWLLHDEIFYRESAGDRMTIEEVVTFADEVLKLDMGRFESDRKSKETAAFIENEIDQARDQGLTGTPSVWVCGIKIRWRDLSDVVDHFLEGAPE